jgi:soluble lytic murein transglycosylase-like protein
VGALRLLLVAPAIASASPAAADPVDRWSAQIAGASARFGIPETWIRRVIRAESGGRTTLNGRPIVSPAGAQGLMQLMPGTWREMRSAHGLGADPHDPDDNIVAGTAYLRAMYDRFGYPGLFAAYNAGPARYAAHLAGGRRLPVETVLYMQAVSGAHPGLRERGPQRSQIAGVFVLLSDAGAAPAVPAIPPAPTSLFVPLRGAGGPGR